MARHRGTAGNVAFGGLLVGTPLLQGAVAQSSQAATIDGVSLTGTVLPGDTFMVAGDPETYVVTVGGEVAGNQVAIQFTPAVVPGGGWADNAAVTFGSSSLAQVRSFEATPTRPVIEATTMGDTAERNDLDVPMWNGNALVLLDYGDAKQKAFIDQVVDDAVAAPVSVTFAIAPGKHLWGTLLPTNAAVVGRRGAHFEVSFEFEGEGVLNPDWN